jgi:hypothetical protein
VRAEQIRTLYRQSVGTAIVKPLNALIVAAMLWPSTSARLLVGWVAAGACRHRRSRYAAKPVPARPAAGRGNRRLGPLVSDRRCGSGTNVGVGRRAVLRLSGSVPQLLLIFVIGGMVAGASGEAAATVRVISAAKDLVKIYMEAN